MIVDCPSTVHIPVLQVDDRSLCILVNHHMDAFEVCTKAAPLAEGCAQHRSATRLEILVGACLCGANWAVLAMMRAEPMRAAGCPEGAATGPASICLTSSTLQCCAKAPSPAAIFSLISSFSPAKQYVLSQYWSKASGRFRKR